MRNQMIGSILALLLLLTVETSGWSSASDVQAVVGSSTESLCDTIAAATFRLDPPTQVIPVGATFSVAVTIADVVDMGAFEFSLTYDPAIIEALSAALGPFPGSTGRTFIPTGPTINNTDGRVEYGAFSLGAAPPGPSGNGALATLTLRARAAGTSNLIYTAAQVSDRAGAPQSVNWENGQVTVALDATPTATTIPTHEPTATWTATPTPTSSRTPTATSTTTNTPTSSPTPTMTATSSRTPTATPTITDTPTSIPTPTMTATHSRTPTATPSATASPTSSSTPTWTATSVSTATPTITPTATPAKTAIPTPTSTTRPLTTIYLPLIQCTR